MVEAGSILSAATGATPVRVALVGCGLIGALWDRAAATGEPATAPSRTHAAAFSRHPGSRLVAVCDASLARAREAAALWAVPQAFDDVAAMLAAVPADLVVIATPSTVRQPVVAAVLAAGVRHLVIEKPLATSVAEGQALLAALQAAGATALVNYSRRWDPSMRALRAQLQAQALGPLQRLLGIYGKGLTNNASHLIDLACFVCDAQPLRARALGSPLAAAEADWSAGADAALDAQLVLADASGREIHLNLIGTDHRAHTVFELRLIGSTGTAEVSLGGRRLTLSTVQDDPDYAGYRIPGPAVPLAARYGEAMDTMAAEALALVHASGQGAPQPSCDAAAALRTALAVAAVGRSAQAQGAWVDVAA